MSFIILYNCKMIRREKKWEELYEGFFNKYSTDFYEYFDKHIVENVINKGEYKSLEDEIKKNQK